MPETLDKLKDFSTGHENEVIGELAEIVIELATRLKAAEREIEELKKPENSVVEIGKRLTALEERFPVPTKEKSLNLNDLS